MYGMSFGLVCEVEAIEAINNNKIGQIWREVLYPRPKHIESNLYQLSYFRKMSGKSFHLGNQTLQVPRKLHALNRQRLIEELAKAN